MVMVFTYDGKAMHTLFTCLSNQVFCRLPHITYDSYCVMAKSSIQMHFIALFSITLTSANRVSISRKRCLAYIKNGKDVKR